MSNNNESKRDEAQVYREIIETTDQVKVAMFLMCWEEDPMMRRIHFNEATTCLGRLTVRLAGGMKREQINNRPDIRTEKGEGWKLAPVENFSFNGIWHKDGTDDIYIFRDGLTGGTFTVLQDGDFISAIANHRAKFGKGFPDKEEMIYER